MGKGIRQLRENLCELYFHLDRLAFALTALIEPGGEAFGETLRGETKAGFDGAVG